MQTFFATVQGSYSVLDYVLLVPAVFGLVFSICAFTVWYERIFLHEKTGKLGLSATAAFVFVVIATLWRTRSGEYFDIALLQASAVVGVLLFLWTVVWLAGVSKSVHRLVAKLHTRKLPVR